MAKFISHAAVLKCHPETCCHVVNDIEARFCWKHDTALALTFTVRGDLTRLRVPSPCAASRVDRLWRHTCFEAFISAKAKPEYYEFNFAPSGEWAVYAFSSYRDVAPFEDEELAPTITVASSPDSLELDATIQLNRLPKLEPGAYLRLALSAVIEEENGSLSYWALEHPPGKPDFHHPDGFALELEAPDLKRGQAQGLAPTINPQRERISGK
jgi:hypothetical protein